MKRKVCARQRRMVQIVHDALAEGSGSENAEDQPAAAIMPEGEQQPGAGFTVSTERRGDHFCTTTRRPR